MWLFLALRPFLPYILGVGVIFGIYYYGYTSGVEKTTQKYEEIIKEEQERITRANELTLKEARIEEKELRRRLNERLLKTEELSEQARTDDNAGRVALGVDSVRRLNTILSPTPKARPSSD